jgi:deoxyribodipyrimidine photo-lyase
MGASYFESLLLDYDPCSNYLNWNYIAGIGNDAREDRYFNVLTQSKKYDHNGSYVRHWLPVLNQLPNAHIHNLDALSNEALESYGVRINIDYPRSMVKLKES